LAFFQGARHDGLAKLSELSEKKILARPVIASPGVRVPGGDDAPAMG
jgi:hypothetical protein